MTTKVRGLDFATLSLLDALDLAVFVEEEAMDRYGELAEQLEMHDTEDAARFFRFMEKNEAKHRATLLEQRTARFGDTPRNGAPRDALRHRGAGLRRGARVHVDP